MARLTKAKKNAISKSADKVTLAGIATQPAAYFAVLIPGAGPFVAGGLVLAGTALGIRALWQSKLARDPPRDDFDQETTLGPPTLAPRVIGGTDFERVAVEFAYIEDEIARIIEAMVTALERASGAEGAGKSAMAEARSAEVLQFGEMLTSRLVASGKVTADLRASLKQTINEHPFPNELEDFPPTLATSLGEDLAAQLKSMGIPGSSLQGLTGPVAEDPIEYLDEVLGELAEGDQEFCLSLQESLLDGTLLERSEPGTAH
jgi:hypothetical protein